MPTTSIFVANQFQPNAFSNYLVGSNYTNAFAIGNVGATDDFFLVGAPPAGEDSYPMLTGNFLDAEGNFLFRIVRNILVVNPRNCSRIMGNHIGYEIHDGEGNRVLKVETTFGTDQRYYTVVNGMFFDKERRQVAVADGGGLVVQPHVKIAMGFNGGAFAYHLLMSQDELSVAAICVGTGGVANQIIRGQFDSQQISIDGKIFIDAIVNKCKIIVSGGDFAITGSTQFAACNFEFVGAAANIYNLCMGLLRPRIGEKTGAVCLIAGRYFSNGCEHKTEQDFASGDSFPKCPRCQSDVFWFTLAP